MLYEKAPMAVIDSTALVLEHAHEAYVSTDAAGNIRGWNRAAESTFGWSRDEALGRTLTELIIPESYREAHERGIRRYLETGEARVIDRRLELEAVDRDGRIFPVEITISALSTDSETTFHAFLHDISERRAAAGAERLAAIVESSADAILATDVDARITDWNPAAERLFGYSRAEIIGEPATRLVPDHLADESLTLWRRARDGEQIVAHETERLRADGMIVAVEITVTRVTAADGPLVCSATYRDISARKRYERELADHTVRLRTRASAEHLAAERDLTAATPAASERAPDIAADVVTLARRHLGMDIAWLAELTDEALRFVALDGEAAAALGLSVGTALPRAQTFCGRMIDGALRPVVPDTANEPALADLPELTAAIGTYLGVPVKLADGRLYGTLCAVSLEPNTAVGESEAGFLRLLAATLTEQLERRRREDDARRAQTELTAVSALLAALDARDQYTSEHSQAVVELSEAVARALGVGTEEVAAVGQVALLHDLGKVGIPDAILQKPGPLSAAEWALMREHPAIGARIVATIEPLAHLSPAVRAEHERWDGTGYPDGRAGRATPLAARVVLACDAYHAMISDRPYRAAIGHGAAVAELRANAGTQFDPDVVVALMGVLGA